MTSANLLLKERLKQYCLDVIEQRVVATQALLDKAQDAITGEAKSSAGDKYETGRAMGHLEQEMHGRQMGEHVKERAMLQRLRTGILFDQVSVGSFVQCGEVAFFIAAGLGKQSFEGQTVVFLSPHAPITKLLMGKKRGDSFPFNGHQEFIVEVF